MKLAKWSLNVRRRSVDDDGTARMEAVLSDAGDVAGVVLVTVTADRALELRWVPAPGAEPLGDFRAFAMPEQEV